MNGIETFAKENVLYIIQAIFNGYDIIDCEGKIWSKNKFIEVHPNIAIQIANVVNEYIPLSEGIAKTKLKTDLIKLFKKERIGIRKSKQRRGRKI